MRRIGIRGLLVCLTLLATSITVAQYSRPVDARSYNLGIIGGFAEVVRRGVKTLALSEVMTPQEMDDIMPDALVVAHPAEAGLGAGHERDARVDGELAGFVEIGECLLLLVFGDLPLPDSEQHDRDRQKAEDYEQAEVQIRFL